MNTIGRQVKVYLSSEQKRILEKDLETFTINRNMSGLCNNIFEVLKNEIFIEIVYLKEKINNNLFEETIEKYLYNKNIDIKEIMELKNKFKNNANIIIDGLFKKESFKYDGYISFRLNVQNTNLFEIEEYKMGSDFTTSDFFRHLFNIYIKKSQFLRERIALKDNYSKLNNAILNKNEALIQLKWQNNNYKIIPYNFVVAKEEQFNYLLALNEFQEVKIIRFSNIEKVLVLDNNFKFEKRQLNELKKIELNFDPFGGDTIEIKIKFTEKGINLYNRIIHNRPDYIKKVDNLYFFKCSANKIFIYFFRFGKEIEILEPIDLRNKFIEEYKNAIEVYRV
jgi:hypothetical protein